MKITVAFYFFFKFQCRLNEYPRTYTFSYVFFLITVYYDRLSIKISRRCSIIDDTRIWESKCWSGITQHLIACNSSSTHTPGWMWLKQKQTKAQIQTLTINGRVVVVKRSLLVHLLHFFPSSFYHWATKYTMGRRFSLRLKHWPNSSHLVYKQHKRTEHNRIVLLLRICVPMVWLCWHVFLHMQFDAVYSQFCILASRRALNAQKLSRIQFNPIHSLWFLLAQAQYIMQCTNRVYNTLNIHCDLSKDFSRGIVDCFLVCVWCVLFYFFFIHVQFCCCFFFQSVCIRLINRLSVVCAQYA